MENKINKNNNKNTKIKIKKLNILEVLKNVKIRHLLLILMLFIANAYAWFIYATKVNAGLSAHVASWNINFGVGEDKGVKKVDLKVDRILPGMDDYVHNLEVYNLGNTKGKLKLELVRFKIFDEVYEVSETYTEEELMEKIKSFPFKINIGASNFSLDPGSKEKITTRISWPYESGDDEKDTLIGSKAYEYYALNPDKAAIELGFNIYAIQLEN